MKVISIDFKKLQAHAKANRWSARQIAMASGLSNGGVNLALHGKVEPSATSLKKICDVIGIPIDEIFVEEKQAA